jgi:hypothetical protein
MTSMTNQMDQSDNARLLFSSTRQHDTNSTTIDLVPGNNNNNYFDLVSVGRKPLLKDGNNEILRIGDTIQYQHTVINIISYYFYYLLY